MARTREGSGVCRSGNEIIHVAYSSRDSHARVRGAHASSHVRVHVYAWSPAMAESVASSSAKRVCLPLKKKIDVLQEVKRRPKVTVRELAQLVFKTLLLHLSKYNTF